MLLFNIFMDFHKKKRLLQPFSDLQQSFCKQLCLSKFFQDLSAGNDLFPKVIKRVIIVVARLKTDP